MIRPRHWLSLLSVGGGAALSLAFLHHSFAKELEGVYTPTAGPCPTPEEQIQKATLPPGYALRCFAHEPMVVNPVAMSWDHRGRLWVVELYEYPSGAKTPNEYSKTATDENYRPVPKGEGPDWPRDRVVILEDTDNDGVADKRTVFVDGLNLATAILCGHGGVYVGQAPNLFFFRDTDGDDQADEYKTVLTGFGLEDRHELLNSFTWGPDGRMYFTHGVFTHSKVRRPGEPQNEGRTLNAGIYRVGFGRGQEGGAGVPPSFPHVSDHEVFADGTSNPWGCDYDAAGNWFVEACVIDHLFHMAPGGLYARQGGAPENPYAYELLPSIVPKDHPKHFRAAYAGIQVYQGGAYPEDTHGHLFFGNIHDNSIHQERVEPVGATFKAHVVRDFLRANDGWFRPVSVQTGPDGFLWVMDWSDKYPCYQNALANPEGVDREKGRVWRIVHAGEAAEGGAGVPPARVFPSRPEKDMDFSKKTYPELIALLSDKNNWVVRMARQMFLDRLSGRDESEEDFLQQTRHGQYDPLLQLANSNAPISVRLEAMRILTSSEFACDGFTAGMPLFQRPPYKEAPPDGAIERQLAFGLVEFLSAEKRFRGFNQPPAPGVIPTHILETFSLLAADTRPPVRAAVASALRKASAGRLTVHQNSFKHDLTSVLEPLIRNSADADKALSFLIWQSLEPSLALAPERHTPWLATLASQTKPLSQVLTYKTMRRLCDTRKPENLDLALSYLDTVAADGDLVATALDGLVKGQEAGAIKPTKDTAAYFEKWAKHEREDVRKFSQQLATLWGDSNAIAAVMGVALSESSSLEARVSAIQTVRKLKDDKARAGIAKLLDSSTPDALTTELLRAAAELGGGDFPNLILKAWNGYSPALKATAAEVLTSRAQWSDRLLDAVEGKWVTSGKLDPATLPVTVRRYFATQAPEAIQTRAKSLLGAWNESAGDIKALIARKRIASLTGEPDLAAGRALFTAACATCHEFHGGGQHVGPELIGSGRSSLDALLNNVIDSNQIIGNGYQNIVVTTKDGRTLSGRLTEDTPTRVRLLGIGGREEVVARDEIEKLEDTGVSLMPSGFGELPDEQFRDLMWFILAPPEEGPLTTEKKAALAAPVTEGEAQAGGTPTPPSADIRIDWESVALWNPDWRVIAPEFEGTPLKLPDFRGRKNVLQLHPYDESDRTKPAALERKLTIPADRPGVLKITCGAHERGDWRLKVVINGDTALEQDVTPDGADGWREFSVPLEPWKGRDAVIRLENHATGWAWEFSYWAEIRIE